MDRPAVMMKERRTWGLLLVICWGVASMRRGVRRGAYTGACDACVGAGGEGRFGADGGVGHDCDGECNMRKEKFNFQFRRKEGP